MLDTTNPRATLTEAEAAQYLGVSPAYLGASRLTEARTDGPPFVRLGRAVRYRPTDLDQWLESRRVETRRAARSGQRGNEPVKATAAHRVQTRDSRALTP